MRRELGYEEEGLFFLHARCYMKDISDLLQGLDKNVWEKTATHPEYEQHSLYILEKG